MTTKLIGIIGFSGTGKTTIIKRACEMQKDLNFVSCSARMVQMLRSMGIPRDSLYAKDKWNDPQPILGGETIRRAAVELGKWGRDQFGMAHWVKLAMNNAAAYGGTVLLDGVRYRDEAARIVQQGGGCNVGFWREGIGYNHPHEGDGDVDELLPHLQTQFTNTNGSIDHEAERFVNMLEREGML